jgi:hypothetical protein
MKTLNYLLAVLLVLQSCSKNEVRIPAEPAIPAPEQFTTYTIAAGAHYCDQSIIKPVTVTQMLFRVKFDSTAIYSTVDPQNQYDINKLFGFTEGQDPHFNSARIGWSYNNGALRLYAYAYTNGQRFSQEISSISIGETISCLIRPEGNTYLFKVDQKEIRLGRANTAQIVSGYQLFPYFGGDETAPHLVRIFIREL